MCLDSPKDTQRIHHVHGGFFHGTEHERRHNYIPARASFFTIPEERILLGVVEVGLQQDARITLPLGCHRGTKMDAIVFGSSLQHDSLGRDSCKLNGIQEVREHRR